MTELAPMTPPSPVGDARPPSGLARLAAHPGCTDMDMKRLRAFVNTNLKLAPEQVQIFTPTPSTYSTLMYYTGVDPFTGEKIFVEKDPVCKKRQKDILTG